MPFFRLGCRREDRLGQSITLLQSSGQRDPTNGTGLLVLAPATPFQVPADDTFKGYHARFANDHAAAFERGGIDALQTFQRQFARDPMVGETELAEPELAHRGQQLALARNPRGEDPVKGADPVSADD